MTETFTHIFCSCFFFFVRGRRECLFLYQLSLGVVRIHKSHVELYARSLRRRITARLMWMVCNNNWIDIISGFGLINCLRILLRNRGLIYIFLSTIYPTTHANPIKVLNNLLFAAAKKVLRVILIKAQWERSAMKEKKENSIKSLWQTNTFFFRNSQNVYDYDKFHD